jgi:hypothetical protein
MFTQDTVISIGSGGINPKYALLNFCKVIFSVLFWFSIFYFQVATLLDLCILFALHPVESQKIGNRSERVFMSTYALCRALYVILVNQK